MKNGEDKLFKFQNLNQIPIPNTNWESMTPKAAKSVYGKKLTKYIDDLKRVPQTEAPSTRKIISFIIQQKALKTQGFFILANYSLSPHYCTKYCKYKEKRIQC